jgi:DNA topoisomerase-1
MAKASKTSSSKAKASKKASASADNGNARKLVVVESPAKAKTINRYLGKDYIVKASMGHVRDLPKKNMGVDLENDFEPTYEMLTGRKKVLTELKKIAKPAEEVYLATDLDREGEAIAWHLAESLGVPDDRIRRVVFNEITSSAIQEAFAHPRDINMNMVNAQQARRILDRIVGYKLSPLLWRKVATGLSAGRVQTVAVRLIVEREREIDAFIPTEYWRMGAILTTDTDGVEELTRQWQQFLAQTDDKGNGPTQAQQQAFLSEHNAFRAELASWKGQRFQADDAEQVLEIVRALGLEVPDVERTEDPKGKGPAANRVRIVTALGQQMPPLTVTRLNQRQSRSRPSAPFTTASLQQAASVRLRFAASRTMRIAQGLYEGVEIPGEGTVGLITYMRTDSTHLSKDSLTAVRSLIGKEYGDKYVPDKPNVFTNRERAQEAHEAVRPTDPSRTPDKLMGSLTNDQYKLYRLIWERFVSCQMTPAVWKVTEADVSAETPAGTAVFKAIGRTLEFDGYLRVAGMPRSGEQILPELAEGRQVAPAEVEPTQHFTQPPPRYTEASLVKALEADNIGRPSTYANIIQTIQDRNYVRQENRSFRPTDLGIVVTDKLVAFFPKLFDVRFTADMEDQLDQVEEAAADWKKILEAFYQPFEGKVEKAMEEMVHAKAETQPSEYTCPKCGKEMVYRFSKNGRYLACTGYPDCKETAPVDEEGKKVERKEVDVDCPKCGAKMMLRRSRYGVFLGCSAYPDCKSTIPCTEDGQPLKLVKPEDIKETCENCGSPMEVKWKGRRAFLACTSYPECKTTAKIPEGVRLEPPPKAEPEKTGVDCPKCGKPLVVRTGRRGKFIACSGFPRCRNAMDMDKLDELKAQQAGKAPAAGQDDQQAKNTGKKSAKKTAKKSSKKASKKSAKKTSKKTSSSRSKTSSDSSSE